MKYLKIFLGCFIGLIIIDIVLILIGLISFISVIFYLIYNIAYCIFHPIKFFKKMKEKSEKPKRKSLNPFVDMLNEELAKIKKNSQTQNNGDFSSNNIQIGNINRKEK